MHLRLLLRALCLTLALGLLHVSEASAQNHAPVEVGSRVWVRLEGPNIPFSLRVPTILRGTLTSFPDDSLVLALDSSAGEARLPLSSVERLYRSSGRETRLESALHSLPWGMAEGMLVGLAASALSQEDHSAGFYVAFAGSGALIKAALGWFSPGERLHRVPLSPSAP